MTDFTKLSDSQVEDAINHHRRMRNQSITLNPNAHARHAQMVKDGEVEQAKREAKKQIRAKLKEEVELDEAEKPAYHYYVTHNKGDKNSDWTVTHSKKKPFATARDAADHIMKSGGRRGGTVHTVNAKTGNIIQARSYDSGQAGYPRDPGMGDPRSIRDLKEEVEQIDELSKNTLNSYRSKANDQLDKDFQNARKGKPGLPNRVVSKRVDGVETAYQKLKKEEVELDEASKPNQYIEVINKFTGAKSHHEVHPSKAFAALNHHNSLWNTKSARIVSGKEAETIKASKMKKEEVELSELSTEKLRDYAGAALQDKNKAKADKRWKYATKATNTVADRDVKAAHALKYNKMEEVDLNEVSASTLRSYIDKSRADKKAAMKDRTAASNNMKKYGNMAMDRKDHDDASRRVVNRNTGVSVANKKLGTYPTDKAKAKVMAREEVELDEQTMPGNVALRLVDRHQAAAFHHKKNGNYKGYAVHFKVADRIEDAVIRAGRDMPVKSKQLEAASDKAFKDHPHHPNRSAS